MLSRSKLPRSLRPARSWRLMHRPFFMDAPEVVAPRLLGKLLARRTGEDWLAGRIVEVEAYLGPHIAATPDPASHSFRGVTARNAVMFAAPGHAYVYFIYGMYFCMNVTCEPEGLAGCILIRALEPVLGVETMARNRGLATARTKPAGAGKPVKALGNQLGNQLTNGPGKLCRALGITRQEHNGVDLLDAGSPLQLLEDDWEQQPVEVTTRIGIRMAAELPLRFSLAGHTHVSRTRPKSPAV